MLGEQQQRKRCTAVVPLYLLFHLPWFQLPGANCDLKILN